MSKKLQVFVSSTYTDLREERQAVIEAILRARHIPAGMELFAAGDKCQLEIIKEWIQDSDIFMLILGGRYGTIEPDSGKSYIELEYEYANSTNKPYFAAVMHDEYLDKKIKADGKNALEREHPDLLTRFRSQVTSRICRFFKSTEELKLAVLESLLDIERTRNLVGWVRADSLTNPTPLIEEIGQLRKENTALREDVNRLNGQLPSAETFGGYEFNAVWERLNGTIMLIPDGFRISEGIASKASVLTLFFHYRKELSIGYRWIYSDSTFMEWVAAVLSKELSIYRLVDYSQPANRLKTVKTTIEGLHFLARVDNDEQLKSQLIPLTIEPDQFVPNVPPAPISTT